MENNTATLPLPPFWFAQRQGKLEPLGNDSVKLTAPNLPERVIGIRRVNGNRWIGWLKERPDGDPTAATGVEYADVGDAWNAAFELYRVHVVC